MAKVKFRMVIIKSSGPINALGGIYAPVLTPLALKVSLILKVILEGHSVYDVSNSGEVLLNTNNYDEDFGGAIPPDPDPDPSHPTGDGNMHVPATGNTSDRKILVAGDKPGKFAWEFLNWNLINKIPSWLSLENLKSLFAFKEHKHNNSIMRPTFNVVSPLIDGPIPLRIFIPDDGTIIDSMAICDRVTLKKDVKFNIERIGVADYNTGNNVWDILGYYTINHKNGEAIFTIYKRDVSKGDIIRLNVEKGFDGGGVEQLSVQLTISPISEPSIDVVKMDEK